MFKLFTKYQYHYDNVDFSWGGREIEKGVERIKIKILKLYIVLEKSEIVSMGVREIIKPKLIKETIHIMNAI